MIVHAYGGYETGDDVDPFEEELVEVNEEIYYCDASPNPMYVCSPQVLQVSPSPDDQRCNLFQTRADVSEGRACKVIIDGGSCRNLASKELCTKLKLKYYPHPIPYFIQWLSDAGEMKVSHIVCVDFQIGAYKDTVECGVVPMTVCHLLLGLPWQYDCDVRHNGKANTYQFKWQSKDVVLRPMSPQAIVNESRQKTEVNLEHEHERTQ
jgi:hypothetical protein